MLAFQTLTVLPEPPLAMRSPSELKETHATETLRVLSVLPLMICFPSGLNATLVTPPRCPLKCAFFLAAVDVP